VLWRIINDTIQIYGGKAYFTDEPFERMMRDARINTIGEGANDVLKVFIAMVGLRDVGLELKSVLDSFSNPFTGLGKIGGFASRKLGALLSSPEIVVRSTELEEDAQRLGRLIGTFGGQVEKLLRRFQEEVLDRQYQLARVADAATELYVSSCVLARIDRILRDPKFDPDHRAADHHAGDHGDAHATNGHDDHSSHSDHGTGHGNGHDTHHATPAAPAPAAKAGTTHDPRIRELELSRYYLRTAERRIRQRLAEMWDNDDAETTKVANRVLKGE